MYKEAQAAPPPSPIGGNAVECGSCTHDFRLLDLSPPPFFSWGGGTFVYEDFPFICPQYCGIAEVRTNIADAKLCHSIIDKAEVQPIFFKLGVKFSYIIRILRILHCCQKLTVSLLIFGKNAMFHYACSPKMRNSALSLNTLCTSDHRWASLTQNLTS
jgi:hypothetical protein